jgi:flavorubredoxin
MPDIAEIAPDLYRIATYVPESDLLFCQFLVNDDEPLLFHTGGRAMFAGVREAVARVIDPALVRWIGFSHFETDECGSLNDWLQVAPNAEAVCSLVGAQVNVNDFAIRPARGLQHDEVLATGKYRFRFRQTPHLPHCWDAGLMFEETQGTLLCSDLFLQSGNVAPLTRSDVVGQTRERLGAMQSTPFGNVVPYTTQTESILHGLAELKPRTLATHHGSAFVGDGAAALRDLAVALREIYDGQ